MVCCRTVCNNLIFVNVLTNLYNGLLVDTGTLVGTHKFDEIVCVKVTVLCHNVNSVGADIGNCTCGSCKHADT